ncbi:hypothetical protein IMG5_009910 [Ichthyophthirius multifiliis]|uniref:RRM domain-containing protein n=1 Tax=Ichthyophthirius multifiliis TaxID=5932 RepID=G0QJW8_ICHMU|nr:hypothetical protein IMG5_009910 [Ichthyophthirius multifiliis]EGR34484.1 hypothetical protein IMG5_009910 [Ichthyophthirius multifiliis]|eukprot:XP_004039788.1 hypothetical protein IMG5_009910 [Ichthyophthirius multifiliis]
MILNLFSFYGKIEKMIYIKDKSSCLIEYKNLYDAQISKDNLNDITFMRNQIKVYLIQKLIPDKIYKC